MKHNAFIQNAAEIGKHFNKIRVIFTAFQDYLYKLSEEKSSGKTIYLLSFRDLSGNRLQEIEEGTFNGAKKLIDV